MPFTAHSWSTLCSNFKGLAGGLLQPHLLVIAERVQHGQSRTRLPRSPKQHPSVEVVAFGSKDTKVEVVVVEGTGEGPSGSKKRKGKLKHKSKDYRSSKSQFAERSAKKVAARVEEVEGLELLKDIQEWWKANREEFRTSSHMVA
ncbi:hypothetical protein Salat_2480000 [Sesamum alatum]|uniref:Uncharacterized protein n=1 Tax=Sesamum alatum TaxID=300844 RepID=A0AAE1XR78_9LAMI|nr:hypothetical protein Salat_2480000 [Sesamum alatum]